MSVRRHRWRGLSRIWKPRSAGSEQVGPRTTPLGGPSAVGQLVSQRLLGYSALYRVAEVEADHVRLQVLHVPGLREGAMVRVTRQAAEMMAATITTPATVSDDLAGALRDWAA
jgi:hypothetical protein